MKKLLSIVALAAVAFVCQAQTARKLTVNITPDGESNVQVFLPQNPNGKTVVGCPGGGYSHLSMQNEGTDWADFFNSQGITYCVLKYRMPKGDRTIPMSDAQNAIRMVRDSAQAWNVSPYAVGIMGFSAGGHLALSSGLLAENKPNAMILGYPAVTTPNHPMSNFMVKLLTGKKEVTDEDCAQFSLEKFITKDAPPVFMAATAEDGLSPYGALLVANCYSKLGLGYELHMFQHGPHGYSLADFTTADGSLQVLNPSFAHWHSLSVDWLYRIFGQPTFTNHSTSRMGKIMAEMGLIPGGGVEATLDGKTIHAGNARVMERRGIDTAPLAGHTAAG